MKTTSERGNAYGKPLKNHLRIAIKWSVTAEKAISPTTVAWMVGADMKSSREINTPTFDNTLDDMGYAACRDSMALQVMGMKGFFKKFYIKQPMPELTYEWCLKYLHRMTLPEMGEMLSYMWENNIE
jgi:hypothetical protein